MFSGGFPGFGFGGGEEEEAQEKKEVDTNAYYELLGVDKKTSCEEIRRAFRKKALKEHPDKGGDPQKFKRLSEANEVLSNPEKRQLYDDYGEEGVKNGGPPGGGGMGGLFEMFSGKARDKGPRKGKPKLIEMEVSLDDIYHGAMRTVKITRKRICEGCEGKGGKDVTKCGKCKGRGAVTKLIQMGPGMYSQSEAKCTDCRGIGEIMKEENRCKGCRGEKVITVEKVLEVAIESGCPNQHDYIFTGENDEYPGIIAGDIYVRIQIQKHDVFQRRGADLIIIKKISLLEALTGVTFTVDHFDGKKHIIATSPGEVLSNLDLKIVKNLGMPFYKDPMGHGNLILQFLVDFPKKLKPEQYEQISKALQYKYTGAVGKNKKCVQLTPVIEKEANPNPEGGKEREERRERGGGGQGVQCQQQ